MRSLPATAAAALGAAVLSLAGGNAFAVAHTGVKSNSGITGVHFGVLDLRPDDGQAAGFSSAASYAMLAAWDNKRPEGRKSLDVPPLQAGRIGIREWSRTFAGTLGNYGELYANAEITDSPYDGSHLAAIARQSVAITLAPHSALSVEGTSNASTQADTDLEHRYDVARTDTSVNISSDSLPNSYTSFLHRTESGRPGSESKGFMLIYANPSDLPLLLTVNFAVMATTWAPIPEPGSYAMMGAGLLLIGALGRRKRGARA